jgi:poly-gamma-glutamate biosynthesis protein PgsC/CapC
MLMSFFLGETIGLAAGGIVVPGYIAMTLHEPVRVISTLAIALAVYLSVRLLSNWMLLYGRRQLILGVLLGYIIGYVTRVMPPLQLGQMRLDVTTIGFVIPGLIAYWMSRQGVVETVSTLLVAGVLARLIITIISGGEITP